MEQLKISIELKSAVVFSSRSGDSTLTGSLSYIPGSSLLGALASRYLKEYGKDEEFSRLFLRGALSFQNLYLEDSECIFYPCSRNILGDKTDDKRFINSFYHEVNELKHKVVEAYCHLQDTYITLKMPQKEIFFHHEREYSSGISRDAKIFNYEALSEGQVFSGYISGAKEDLELLLKLIPQDGYLRLGKSKTSQYGNCKVIASGFERRKTEIDIVDDNPVMIMLSDTIIRNKYGKSVVDIRELKDLLGVEILESAIATTQVETVVNAHKAKKPMELAFKAGSSFLLKELPPDSELLLARGLGERCHEGFGTVVFTENIESPIYMSTKETASTRKPDTALPPVLKELVEKAYERVLENQLVGRATELAKNLNIEALSKSLIGRLESFVASGDFNGNFKQFRNLAKDKLKKVNLEKENLKEYLDNIDSRVADICNQAYELHTGKHKTLYQMLKETDIERQSPERWKTVYLKNLFLAMRRELKNKEADNA